MCRSFCCISFATRYPSSGSGPRVTLRPFRATSIVRSSTNFSKDEGDSRYRSAACLLLLGSDRFMLPAMGLIVLCFALLPAGKEKEAAQ